MKAAIYNPYLDTLGGGERYTLAFADVLAKLGYSVYLNWKSKEIIEKLENKFGISLKNVKVVENVNNGAGYDILFWVSDGSIPLLQARKNILHFQIPFNNVKGNSLLNKMKLFRINKIVCNSVFTKNFIDKEFNVKSDVIYPPIDVTSFKAKKKENVILALGRFSQLTQAKSQHVLIDVFKRMLKNGLGDWQLVLAGGVEVGVGNYLQKLKKMSEGYPITIKASPSFKEIKELYGKSKLFWSASGFGIDEKKQPLRVEHFGITVVEAMSAGAVPLVFNAGGHKESVKDGVNGFLWSKKTDLIKKTNILVNDAKLLKTFSKLAITESKKYSYEEFSKKVKAIIYS